MIVASTVSSDARGVRVFHIGGDFGVDPRRLAEFAERHPNADADRNGKVSNAEREAYVAAQALSDPQAVLAQFPHADHNGNGTLDTLEAARLVGSAYAFIPHNIEFDEADSGTTVAEGGVMKITLSADADVSGENVVMTVNGVEVAHGPAPSRWVQENIDTQIEPEAVAALQGQIRLARNAELIERHPEADADGDGDLTDAERQAFEEELMARVAEQLETLPETGDFDIKVGEGGIQVRKGRIAGVVEDDGGAAEPKTDAPADKPPGKKQQADNDQTRGADAAKAKLLKGDEWYEYTVAFIKRYELDKAQRDKAFEGLKRCYRLRDTFVRKLRIKDESERKTRIDKYKERIFERQLKPRLDRLPTRKQRQAAKDSAAAKP